MNFAQYDPTGRFLLFFSTETKIFSIWNCLGDKLYTDKKEMNIFPFWRPKK